MPIDLNALDQPDARLFQAGLKHFGFYDGTLFGNPGPKTRAAYDRYRNGGPTDVVPAPPAELLPYPRTVRDEIEFPGEIADGTFATIEGNTNDEGSREGYEVCRRVRGRGSKDFIRLI